MKLKLRFYDLLDKIFLFRKETQRDWALWKKCAYWAWRAALLLACAAGIGYTTLKFAYALYPSEVFAGYFQVDNLVLWNILPAVWLVFFLFALFGRAWIAFLIGGGSVLVLSLGNFFKLLYRDDPLIFEDLLILREAGLMATGDYYAIFIDNRIALAIACVVAATLGLLIFARGAVKNWKARVALLLVAAISGTMLLNFCCDKTRYNSVENYEHLNRWNQTQQYISRGCLYPFVYSIGETLFAVPDGYTKGQAEKLLSEYTDADIPEDKKVNFITIMREAYVDFSKFGVEGLTEDCYQYYHELQAESYTGTLLTNIFAGGTIDSERSFLNGLGDHHSFRTYTNSYLWYLKDQGYTVEGSHPYYSWFYDRDNINTYIGFDNYRFLDGDYEKYLQWQYVSDRDLFSEIYNDYVKNKESGKPYFSFSLNMQSHGPYYTTVFTGHKEYFSGDYTEGCINAMKNYLYSIMSGDEQLKIMIDQLRTDEEPVVLVMFGDHLPWMGDGNVFYEELGIDVDINDRESFRTRFETEYLIWANDAAKEILGNDFVGEGPTVSPHYLMNLVFEQCGFEGPAYMQAMSDIMETLNVVTSNNFLMVGETLVAENELSKEQEELYRQYLYLQHYWRNEFQYKDLK